MSSTNSQISSRNESSNPSFIPPKVQEKLSPMPHLPVKKLTRKQYATIVTREFPEERKA
jgi:hypothetical protein